MLGHNDWVEDLLAPGYDASEDDPCAYQLFVNFRGLLDGNLVGCIGPMSVSIDSCLLDIGKAFKFHQRTVFKRGPQRCTRPH